MRMHREVSRTIVLVALCVIHASIAESQGAAPDPWYSRSARPRDFEVLKDILGKFTIELPRDWQLVPGYGGVVFTSAEKPRNNDQSVAAIVLEQMRLRDMVALKDITPAFAKVELDAMRERQVGGENFEHQVKEADGRRFIFIQYSKPGSGGVDRVVQYSIPVGAVMYRLICIAPAAQLPKYQQMFAHAAASFKAS